MKFFIIFPAIIMYGFVMAYWKILRFCFGERRMTLVLCDVMRSEAFARLMVETGQAAVHQTQMAALDKVQARVTSEVNT